MNNPPDSVREVLQNSQGALVGPWNYGPLRRSASLTTVILSIGAVILASFPAGAASIAQDKNRAASLYAQIQRVGAQVQSLGQAYDQSQLGLAQITQSIDNTRLIVANIAGHVKSDNLKLKADAIVAYVDGTSALNSNQLFWSSSSSDAATSVYRRLAEGNVGMAIASFQSEHVRLQQERRILEGEQSRAVAASGEAAAALHQALALQVTLDTSRTQVEGRIATYYASLQAAAEAASARAIAVAVEARKVRSASITPDPSLMSSVTVPTTAANPLPTSTSAGLGTSGVPTTTVPTTTVPTTTVPTTTEPTTTEPTTTEPTTTVPIVATPPASSVGSAVVLAAERYIGVPYVWGGASPSGLDCSGLVMLAFQAVDVSLPHYSGAQFADSVAVPLGDIQPADLLFYGPGGSAHEAMYVGNGMMIEAPQTGDRVNITPVRLGYGFVGVRRVGA